MQDIVLATPEQVERIRAVSDLEPPWAVYALGEDLGVVKQVTEIDPIHIVDPNNGKRTLLFMWGLETHLRLSGIPAYYFNVDADNLSWQKVLKTHGAEPTTEVPQIRFKKVLNYVKKDSNNQ